MKQSIKAKHHIHRRSEKHDLPKIPPEGFWKINERSSHGQPIFSNYEIFISPDVDQHNGGWWKVAKSIKKLEIKGTSGRIGTFNRDLTQRMGD